jgi:hypothetical protein
VVDPTGVSTIVINNFYLTLDVRAGTAWANGEGVMIIMPSVNALGSVGRVGTDTTPAPYFTGDSPWIDSYYASTNNPNTASKWDFTRDDRWTVDSAGGAYYAFVQTPKQDPLGTSLSFHALGFDTTTTQSFTIECDAVAYAGQPYALRFSARAMNGVTPTVELLKKTLSDPEPVSLGSVSVPGTAVSAVDTGVESTPVVAPPQRKGLQELVRLTPDSSIRKNPNQSLAMDPTTRDLYVAQCDHTNPIENMWVSRYDYNASDGSYSYADKMSFPSGGHGGALLLDRSGSTVYLKWEYRNDYWVRVPYSAGATRTRSYVDDYKTKKVSFSGAKYSDNTWHQGEIGFEGKYYRLYGAPSHNKPEPYLEIIKNKKVEKRISLPGIGRQGVKAGGAIYGGRFEPEGINVAYIDHYPYLIIGCTLNHKNSTNPGRQYLVYTYPLPYTGTVVASAPTSYTNYGFVSGDFADFAGPTYTPGAVTDRLFVKVTVPVQAVGNSILQFSQLAVSNGDDIYDGDTANTTDWLTAWDGTKYASKSVQLTRKVKGVASPRVRQNTAWTPEGYPTGAPMAEMFAQYDDEDPTLVFDPQDITGQNGLFFSVDALGSQNFDGAYLDNTTVSAQGSVDILDASGTVLTTVTGDVTPLNLNVDDATLTTDANPNTNVPVTVSVAVPYASIPSTAATARASISMVDAQRGTGILLSRVMLLSVPVSSAHLGRLPYFDGDSGDGYFWNGDVNDSTSGASAVVPWRWNPLDGGLVAGLGPVSAKGGPDPTGTPLVTLSTDIHSGTPEDVTLPDESTANPAGHYLFGLQIAPRILSDLSTSVLGAVSVQVQFLYGGAQVGISNTSLLSSNMDTADEYLSIQGGADVAADFDEVRYLVKSAVVAEALSVKLRRAYLYLDNGTVTAQHLNTNKIVNPDLRNAGHLWTVSNGSATVTDDGDMALAVGASIASRVFGTTPGGVLRFATWALFGITPKITYYTSTAATSVVSTVTAPTITQGDFDTLQSLTYTVPAGANAASVTYTATGSQVGVVRSCYVASDYALHEDDGFYDPLLYSYFDGSTPDLYGSPASWTGTANNSASVLTPAIPAGWVTGANNVHRVLPLVRPIGSTGRTGGLLRAPKGTTRTYRTVAVPRDSKYLSGQMSVAALPGTSISLALYQADTTTATGTMIWNKVNLGNTNTVLQFNDLQPTNKFVYAQITYTENADAPGYRVFMDNLSMIFTASPLGTDYPGYFDGNQRGQWLGDVNDSVSQYFGGGRRAWAEVRDAIDMSSMAGGTRAEFVVSMDIVGSFWEDLTETKVELDVAVGDLVDGVAYSLDALGGTTAPISDSVIVIESTDTTGTVSDLVLQDVATGAWVRLAGTLPATVIIDNADFRVSDADGHSLITTLTRGGSNQLVPITPMSSVDPPTLGISAASTSTSGVLVTVTARRRYVVA